MRCPGCRNPGATWTTTGSACWLRALGRLGRLGESAPVRQQVFERSLAVYDLQQWLEHLPETAHADRRSRARRLALDHDDPIAAAAVLLEIGDD